MHQYASPVLGGFLVLASIAHVAAPVQVERLVPDWWPAPRPTVYASGLVELVCGIAILIPDSRSVAASVATVMFVGYAGVHAGAFRHTRTATGFFGGRVGVVVRTLVNLGYAAWAWYVAVG